jgi:hypothetical protein
MKYTGIPVSIEMLPAEARHIPPRHITPDGLDAFLRKAGDIELCGNDLKVGAEPDYGAHLYLFLACDRFSLLDGARLVTNGHKIVILCNVFESRNGGILSFLSEHAKAENGAPGIGESAPGAAGSPGESGGMVSIHILRQFIGTLDADLSAQAGGDGGSGSLGRRGEAGAAGLDSLTKVMVEGYPPIPYPRCVRGAQTGHKGGTGFPGGNGGNGGSGGHGGILEILNAGPTTIPTSVLTFISRGGLGGAGGAGGLGGAGGPGGSGGRGSFSGRCAKPGAEGNPGAEGSVGEKGPDGQDGHMIVQHLDIRDILESVQAK